jgi:hypothetical protein
MEKMMERLLASQEQMVAKLNTKLDADRKADKEEMKANRKADKEETEAYRKAW